jgi:hypothetical protein
MHLTNLNCKGCIAESYPHDCACDGEADKCPCAICIVKVVCKQICEEYEDAFEEWKNVVTRSREDEL